jgi:glycogen operon protein
VCDPVGSESLYVALNAFWEALEFELPRPTANCRWCRVIDTALASPDDIAERGAEPVVAGVTYRAEPRSAVVLLAR